MKINIGNFVKNDLQRMDIRIEKFDTYNTDCTLAHIILPMLIQHRNTHHGIPGNLSTAGGEEWDTQLSFDFYRDSNAEAFDICCERWNELLDKMIWAFEQVIDDTSRDKYFNTPDTGNHWYDRIGHDLHEARIQEGLSLFGEYYRALWD
tara:strand:+ start:1023 stop:1469 length:447 start_codon:yes stop_codon:yes gene_type:complete